MPETIKAGLFGRRQFLCACCTALAGARMVPAFAALGDDAGSAVLASNEPHHHVVLQNGAVRVFRVMIPPGRSTLWHEHNFDFVVLAVNGTKLQVEVPTIPQAITGTMVTKTLTYTNYAGKHFVHRIANTDIVVNHQLCLEIIPSSPSGFEVSDRSEAPQYKMEIDNTRIRAWRIQLAPGEIADSITQKAPGVRFVLSGDRIAETDSGGAVKEAVIQTGDFAWLPGATARSVSNAGSSPLELVEVELK
jgi:quercetin dioxygenase-like cupin family protein